MSTRIFFEMDGDSLEGRAILTGLSLGFREHCPFGDVEVTPRYVEIDNSRVADAIVGTAAVAEKELAQDEKALRCIYLSPRALLIAEHEIRATIYAIRDRTRLIAARVQVIHDESLRPLVQRSLGPEMYVAHRQLFGGAPTSALDNDLAIRVSVAIGDGYARAHNLLFGAVGSA